MAGTSEVIFSRIQTDIVNRAKIEAIFDFVVGDFLANRTFFNELNRISTQMLRGENVTLQTGQTVDPKTTGGLLAINFYMETVSSARETMSGLSKLGLSVEKQVWKFQ